MTSLGHLHKVLGVLLFIVMVIGTWTLYDASHPSSGTKVADIPGQTSEPKDTGSSQEAFLPKRGPVKAPGTLPLLVTPPSFSSNSTYASTSSSEDNLQKLGNDLISGSEDEQVDAIKILYKHGTPQQKGIIESYAVDPNKEISARVASIENIDWETNANPIGNIIEGGSGVSEATLYIASTKDLSDEARAAVDGAAYTTFYNTSRPSTQIAILDYFLEQHDNRFDELAPKVPLDQYSQEEKEDLDKMMKKREEDR